MSLVDKIKATTVLALQEDLERLALEGTGAHTAEPAPHPCWRLCHDGCRPTEAAP